MSRRGTSSISSGAGYGLALRLADLLTSSGSSLMGRLTQQYATSGFSELSAEAINAWTAELERLAKTAAEVISRCPEASEWGLVLEFDVPRRGKRIDAVLITQTALIVIEFKSAASPNAADRRQVEDYCLELADFHRGSRNAPTLPLLVPEGYGGMQLVEPPADLNSVWTVSVAGGSRMSEAILALNAFTRSCPPRFDLATWLASPYRPTPTITEAAAHLYANHDVGEIARSEANRQNLVETHLAIKRAVEYARANNEKTVCFVTGVPGAGKTLAGLNAVCRHDVTAGEQAVFLSGNGPLVKVLVESLARDDRRRNNVTKTSALQKSSKFVQGVHAYIRHHDDRSDAPIEQIVVFDEAQRAWNAAHAKRKFQREDSEPRTMLRILDRHADWVVLVCLVGGGQEINTGEAGLREWGRALETAFRHWRVVVSETLLHGDDSTVGRTLFADEVPSTVVVDSAMHLSVPVRAYRGTRIADWVEAVLAGDSERALGVSRELEEFAIHMTRSLDVAKQWLRETTRGERRCGIVASSGGKRLRRFGLSVEDRIDVGSWFLEQQDDVRSSLYLEQAATEFDIQGLELDRVAVCWDADLRKARDGWQPMTFRGSAWNRVRQSDRATYQINKYRVLLTRAREGMVIWIPQGDEQDKYALPEYYDQTAAFLRQCGATEIPATVSSR